MSNEYSVSVIIPLYNRRALIAYTLDSLKDELHPGVQIEVIVIDDGSNDGSYEYVQEQYSWVKLFKNTKKGAPSARNSGLQKAKHDFIVFLDSDDIVSENFFHDKIKFMQTYPEVAGVYGPWLRFKSDGLFSSDNLMKAYKTYPLIEKPQWKQSLEYLLEGWFIHPHAILWRKTSLLSVNGFTEDLIINQDVDLMFRLLVREYTLSGAAYPVAYVREHSGERVGAAISMEKQKALLEVRTKFYTELVRTGKAQDLELKRAFAKYCYSWWIDSQQDPSSIGDEFLRLSKKADPNYTPNSGKVFNILVSVFGAERAVRLRHWLNKTFSR